jgi:hypothetical protein
MKNGEKANACAQMLRVAGDRQQSFSGGAEQDDVNRLLVVEGASGDLFRNRENDIEIFDRQ